jgi:hypothetical protein
MCRSGFDIFDISSTPAVFDLFRFNYLQASNLCFALALVLHLSGQAKAELKVLKITTIQGGDRRKFVLEGQLIEPG